jgi:hypothetical protein
VKREAPDDLAEHMRAVSLRRDELIADATALQAATFRRLAAAGISRSTVDAIGRDLDSPPQEIPFVVILVALADRLTVQAETARTLAVEWQGWNARVEDLADEGVLRAQCLEDEKPRIH